MPFAKRMPHNPSVGHPMSIESMHHNAMRHEIITLDVMRDMAQWDKWANASQADECGDGFWIEKAYRAPSGFATGAMNKGWGKKDHLNMQGMRFVSIGQKLRHEFEVKKCDMGRANRIIQTHIDQKTEEANLMFDEWMLTQAADAVQYYNQGWNAGKRYGNIQLGTLNDPVILGHDNVQTWFSNLKYVFQQLNINMNAVSSDEMFMTIGSPMQMLMENAPSTRDFYLNGNCNTDCAKRECFIPDQYKCWNLCVKECGKPQMWKGMPVFEVVFGFKKAFKAVYDFWIEVEPPKNRKHDAFCYSMQWTFGSYVVDPQYLAKAYVAVPAYDFRVEV